MTVKLMVLYPQPLDVEKFERQYTQQHLVLMRKLVGPDIPLPTYKIVSRSEKPSPFYRVAEIHFCDRDQLNEFAASGRARLGKASSENLSSGGTPTVLICDQQPPI